MHTGVTQNSEDNETEMLAGVPASLSPRLRRREPVIQVFSQRPAAQRAGEESDLDEGVSSLGSLSVRLLAEWSKPRMMLPPPGGVETAAPDSVRGGEERSRDW
ncbi:hypothetical protein [Rhizobium phage RHEph18]|nr:hypothetical protein AMJ99_CH01083 [Rhizobium esperanzae]ANM33522.1 hypothetical protein AMK04_CH01084 [Rhizobium sp. N871]QIG73755.1 hypothetical protein EVC05_063 [Rhizobium phage RHph_N2]QXV74473.1 hypothetical protein [Rhizobium phage RHEph18]